ncbi:MAG: hypothetical protein QW478_10400 [Candidatus Micrarchaeaceae archaeon]
MEEKEIITYGVIFVIILVAIVFVAKIVFYPSTSQPTSALTNKTTSTTSINIQHEFANNTFNLTKSSNKILFGNTTYKDLFNKTYYYDNELNITHYLMSLPTINVSLNAFVYRPENIILTGNAKNITINLEGNFAQIYMGTNPNATVTIMNGIYVFYGTNKIINNNAYNIAQ